MPNFFKLVLDVYSECLRHVWAWTKILLIGLAVLLPGLICLIYMFATNTPDIGIIPSIIVIWLIVLWAPIPLRPFFYKDKALLEMYTQYLIHVAAAICLVIAVIIYLGWMFLPILIEVAICTIGDRNPMPLEGLLILIGNLIWGPVAYCMFNMLLEKIYKNDKKES